MADELPPDDEWSIWQAKHAAVAESRRLRAECEPYEPEPTPAAYSLSAFCAEDSTPLEHVAAGTPGMKTSVIGRCPACNRRYQIEAGMTDVTRELGVRPAHPPGCSCRPCERGRAAA